MKENEKKNSSQNAIKAGAWYTISNFLVRGMGFITTPIFTRLLTKNEFGAYNNYSSWLAILTVVVTLNLESTFISARYDYEKDFDSYIFSVLFLSMLSAVTWMLFMNVFSSFTESFLSMDRFYINCMMLYLLFMPAIHMFQARERYFFRYKTTVLTSLFVSVGSALLSVVLVLLMSNKYAGRIIGSIIPTIGLGFLITIYFFMKARKIKLEYWKYALPICLPFIPHLLSLSLLNSMDRTMITKICGNADAAMYGLAYTCGTLVTLLITSLNSAFAPWMGEKLKNEERSAIHAVSRKYIAVFVFLAIGIMLLAPEILMVLGGKTYIESKYVMPPVALGCICQFMYILYVNVEQFKKKTVGMALASVSAAALNYGLNLYFIPRYGYIAAAYTTLVGFLWLFMAHMLLVHWLGYSDVFDTRFILSVLGIAGIVTLGVNYLYMNTILRYAVIAAYGLLVLYLFHQNRDTVMVLLKRKK